MGARLSSTELSQSVRLLLVKHLPVLELGLNVGLDIGLSRLVGRLLVCLILAKHLLEIFFFLSTLLLLKLTLHLHFLLQAVNQVDLLSERILVLCPLACFLFA